jgi:hypothetical protein
MSRRNFKVNELGVDRHTSAQPRVIIQYPVKEKTKSMLLEIAKYSFNHTQNLSLLQDMF